METFAYETKEVAPDKLELALDAAGADGWRFVNMGMVQRPIMNKVNYNPAIPQFEIKLLLIFERKIS